jgi:Cof subfamily protein (haloacid dehalogenase superfamily)
METKESGKRAKTIEIKAVFFDIDGTLVSFKTNSIPQSTVKAIERLRAQGIKVVVSTGRSINTINHVKYLDFDGFICFNGGCCVAKDGTTLHRQAISKDDIRNLLDYSQKQPLSFALMYENSVSIHDVTPEVAGMYAHLNLPVPPLIDREKVDLATVLQANIFLGPQDELKFMEDVMPNSVATRWTPLFADVNCQGLSKMIGVEIFCKAFNIDVSNTMSFGDGGNDIAMIQGTAIGVAMGNANQSVKDIADYVTADVDSDGIWKALEHFGILR